MFVFFPSRISLTDNFGKLCGSINRCRTTLTDNSSGNAFGKTLLAILAKDRWHLFRGSRSNPFLRTGSHSRIHPHVQRAIVQETETALGLIQLRGRHAEIQQDAVYLTAQALLLQDMF